MRFQKYFLLYTLVPLFVLSLATSYYRFMVIHDYLVEYEGECDPEISSCFIGCEDEACTVIYPYRLITRHATELQAVCGADITDCTTAQSCHPGGDDECSVLYCDTDVDEVCYSAEDKGSSISDSVNL